jgi:phosphonate transport system permease protein
MTSKKYTSNRGSIIPPRFRKPTVSGMLTVIALIAFSLWSMRETETSLSTLIRGVPDMIRIVGEMSPPDLTRLAPMSLALLKTFQIAFVGASFGIIGSFFLSLGATRSLSGNRVVYTVSRSVISFFRTVPDLVWAIFFVASVGLGPFAGILTIMVDTMGFCGRFFAEAMEEVDKEPQQALEVIGARRIAIIFTSIVPEAMPSFINTSLFSLEKAVRASVILGLVGAGGIGIELKAAMDMFSYKEAAMVIILIFALVIAVERISSAIRKIIL